MLNASGRPRTMPARCPTRTAGRPSSSSAMSATASRSMPTSPARGRTTPSSPTARAFASTSKTCASRRSASGCSASGSTRMRSTRRATPRRSRATSPSASRQSRKRWRRRTIRQRTWRMFLMRCLFTMFAEDVELLPEEAFEDVLEECRSKPEQLRADAGELWQAMDSGDFAASIRSQGAEVQRRALRRSRGAAARPRGDRRACASGASKTGTRSSPRSSARCWNRRSIQDERKRLGAHYTPRAYVERLVVATIIEPLREDWRNVQADGRNASARRATRKGAAAEVQAFPRQAVRDARARSGLRHRQLSLCLAGIDEAARRRGAGSAARSRRAGSAARLGWPHASIRTSSSGSRSTRARRPSPNWCSGSAICNGTSAPRAARRTSRSCESSRTSRSKNAVLTWDG